MVSIAHIIKRMTVPVSVVLLLVLLLSSLAVLPFSMRWYNTQSLDDAVRHSPSLDSVPKAEAYYSFEEGGLSGDASGADQSWVDRWAPVVFRATSWLGHDDLGRSVLFRLAPAYLISLGIGWGTALFAMIVGTVWGAIAAFAGGHVDAVLMRIVDVLYTLPYILMVIVLKLGLQGPTEFLFGAGSNKANVVVVLLAITSVSWLTLARIVRGQVLSLRSALFVEAARAAGAGPVRILLRHMLPHLRGPILVFGMLVVPQAILQESFLSFLGIGIQPPMPSLGQMAAEGVEAVNAFVGYWWLLVYPCSLLVLTLPALHFIGDRLKNSLSQQKGSPSLFS